MDQLDPQQVESLFHEALDVDAALRDAYLKERCPDDGELRRAVAELLEAAHRVAVKPSWNSPAIHIEAAQLPPSRLDRYEIQERIGAGGMGVVYKALRKEGEFTKVVALKIVHSDHPALLQRFHQERQILAGLDHPHIVRLLDVGTTEDGSPYLAMDYIDGVLLDRYLKANPTISEREILQLFLKIAGAVSFAHRNLVVHRDLKPANILVMPGGEPRLLDFGVAKLLETDSEKTRTGAGAMTAEYASPEQVTGGVITASSDIYALGVLLYEMLSGARPYGSTKSPLELAEAITSAAPKRLEGKDEDLERIVQMALRKEPERRYLSVEGFSEDVRRYLDGFPVLARTSTWTYRSARFVKRNRIPLVAAALLAVAVAAGVYSTIRQARIAQRHFNEVRKLANSYLFEVYDGLRDLEGATPLRQLVVKRALEYLDSLSQEQGNDAGLSRELASAYARVGAIKGEPGFANLGDPIGALVSYRKALVIREKLVAASPSSLEAALEEADSHHKVGNLLVFQGDTTAAVDHLRKAVAISERLAKDHPTDLKVADSQAIGYTLLASVTGSNEVSNLGNPKAALELFEKARSLREKIQQQNPSDRMNRVYLSAIFPKMASIDRAMANDPAAIKAILHAIALIEVLVKEDSTNAVARRDLAVSNRSLSLTYIAVKNFPEARKAGDRSAETFRELAHNDPKNIQAQEEVADSEWSQGYTLESEKDFDGAYKHYETAIGQYRKLMEGRPEYLPKGMRSAYQLVAGLSAKLGDTARAYAAAQNELAIDDQMLKVSPANVNPKLNRGVALLQIAQSHQTRARKTKENAEWREALSWSQRSMEVWTDLKKQGVLNAGYASFTPRTQAVMDEAAKALASAR